MYRPIISNCNTLKYIISVVALNMSAIRGWIQIFVIIENTPFRHTLHFFPLLLDFKTGTFPERARNRPFEMELRYYR